MAKAETRNEAAEPTARLLSSDAPTSAEKVGTAGDAEHPFWVDGQPVSREEYMIALPKAGYVPERLPENHFPHIGTK